MKNTIKTLFLIACLLPLTVYAGPKLGKFAAKNSGKKIAVVSISANNYGDSLQGWNSANTSDLMATQLNSMLDLTEALFANDFEVVKASTFVPTEAFQNLAGEQREVGLPKFGEHMMPLLSKNRKQLIKGQIDKDKAKALVELTGADYLVLIYSEWTTATGGIVPTTKSFAKNVVNIIDGNGKSVYQGRQDEKGNKTLGAFGGAVVDENSISQWVVAYEKGLKGLYNKGRKKKV
ncbi:hypothetical protein TDB9533_03577 [Thalassocella blandensis]|nr:hypothetical protein TDB9533_03577 [Thalassocella blandensis]